MRIDQPSLKRLHIEATYLNEALLEKSKHTTVATSEWLRIASDHLTDCVTILETALDQSKDPKEKDE